MNFIVLWCSTNWFPKIDNWAKWDKRIADYIGKIINTNSYIPWQWGIEEDYLRARPDLIDVEEDWTSFCKWEAPLFINTSWHSNSAHWSDVVFSIVWLTSKILNSWETITQINEIKFSRQIKNNVNIFICEKWQEEKHGFPNKQEWSMYWTLTTSSNRQLNFIVIEKNNDPIKEIRNPIKIRKEIFNILKIDINNNEEIEVIINWKIPDDMKALENNSPLHISILIDFISSILIKGFLSKDYLKLQDKNLQEKKPNLFLTRVSNLNLLNMIKFLENLVKIKINKSREIESWKIFYNFSFLDKQNNEIANIWSVSISLKLS